jgi:hypothetical protein
MKKQHHQTVDRRTLTDMVYDNANEESQGELISMIAKAKPKELDAIHINLLKMFDDSKKAIGVFEDPTEYWNCVEAELLKINGILALRQCDNGSVSYIMRDLSNTGDRPYLEYTSTKNAEDYLIRKGIRIQMTLGKNKPLNLFEHWCHQPLTQEQSIVGFVREPWSPGAEAPVIIDRRMNIWHSGFNEPVKGDKHLEVLKFIKEVICSNDEYCYDVIIKWMADLVQNPAHKNNLCPVIFSERRGIGKTTFASIIQLIVGKYNGTLDADGKDLQGFDAMIGGKLFVNFDETTFGGDHQQLNSLKKRITNATERNEGKGKDAVSGDSFCRYLITTNSPSGTMGSAFERRFFDLPISPSWKDKGIIDKFVNDYTLKVDVAKKHLKDGVYKIDWVQHMTYFLLREVDLTRFNFNDVKSPMTGDDAIANRMAKTYQENPIFGWLWQWLDSGEDMIKLEEDRYNRGWINDQFEKEGMVKFGGEITKASLYDIFIQQSKGTHGHPPERGSFVQTLRKKYSFVNGKDSATRKNTFKVPSREELYKTMFHGEFGMNVTYELPKILPE